MGIYTQRNGIYSQQPISIGSERDEYFLIDVLGTWVPECDIIFYGLLNSHYAEELYKLRENALFNPKDVYLDHCYFTAKDLVRYLSSVDDNLDDLPKEEINNMIQTALHQYVYVPSNETMIRHSIMEIMYHKFVQGVTLVYPWVPRPIDIMYLRRITPQTIFPKLIVASGNIISVIKESGERYTTIITNDIDQIDFLVDHAEEYKVDTTVFLLRNHSENMRIEYQQDGSPLFIEDKMDQLLPKFIDSKTGLPKNLMRLGRFEPRLYDDMLNTLGRFKNF